FILLDIAAAIFIIFAHRNAICMTSLGFARGLLISQSRNRSGNANDDLAEVRSRGHVFERFARLFEWKNAIDYGSHFIERYAAIHSFDLLAAADHPPLTPQVFNQNRKYFQLFSIARQHAYQAYVAADADCAQRFLKRARAAHFYDVIKTGSSCQLARALIPIRGRPIVDAVGRPELYGSPHLLVAARSHHDPGPCHYCQLDPHNTDPPRSP